MLLELKWGPYLPKQIKFRILPGTFHVFHEVDFASLPLHYKKSTNRHENVIKLEKLTTIKSFADPNTSCRQVWTL